MITGPRRRAVAGLWLLFKGCAKLKYTCLPGDNTSPSQWETSSIGRHGVCPGDVHTAVHFWQQPVSVMTATLVRQYPMRVQVRVLRSRRGKKPWDSSSKHCLSWSATTPRQRSVLCLYVHCQFRTLSPFDVETPRNFAQEATMSLNQTLLPTCMHTHAWAKVDSNSPSTTTTGTLWVRHISSQSKRHGTVCLSARRAMLRGCLLHPSTTSGPRTPRPRFRARRSLLRLGCHAHKRPPVLRTLHCCVHGSFQPQHSQERTRRRCPKRR